ncbi:hypothetical protein TELCIR_10831 [Teladorsagia circumcincta]|uniref:Uncharacterized protein n=1 Tax=Teladorsagia circumcincta TaxID=45464 RepID=A0A2G9UCG0_TELCI|nr:hypothetical protein TELCIR_10831 [Teladorsagia circumcincta]
MAWATTQSVGCAVAPCDSYWSVVCHYTPGGNELNKHLYMKGSPCSNCPDGMFCNAQKLCRTSSSITQ